LRKNLTIISSSELQILRELEHSQDLESEILVWSIVMKHTRGAVLCDRPSATSSHGFWILNTRSLEVDHDRNFISTYLPSHQILEIAEPFVER